MIGMPHGARIWPACGATDMRRGFDGLAAMVQTQLSADPYAGHLVVFRGRLGNRLKILWYSDQVGAHPALENGVAPVADVLEQQQAHHHLGWCA
jgi:transposase